MFKAAGTRLVFLAAGILTGTEISSASLRQDRDPGTFLERGIEMAHAGIQLAEVATNKAEDARVKHFAKIMAGRQKQVLQTLQSRPLRHFDRIENTHVADIGGHVSNWYKNA